MDRFNRFFHRKNISVTFVEPYTLWDMDLAALKSVNGTDDGDCTFNQYPKTTSCQHRLDLYPVISSRRRMDKKRKGFRVSFTKIQKNYLPDGRVNVTVATVEELSDLWKLGAMD